MDESFNPVVAESDVPTKRRLERDASSGFGSRSSRDLTDASSFFESDADERHDATSLTSSRARSSSATPSDVADGTGNGGDSSRDYFDTFSRTPIYYFGPEFSKKVPTPKKFPDLTYDDFLVQPRPHSGKAKTISDSSNWVLLPAAWGSTPVQVVDPVEAKN
jgi:hypothetical protein